MFTGIVEELGKIRQITDKSLYIECQKVLEDSKIGDSIAVNGVCLTVVRHEKDGFIADVSGETFKVTGLGKLKCGSLVNLERAIKADGRFGGHIVSGHVDGIGEIIKISQTGKFYDLKIKLNSEQEKYSVKKGSICINGISLTIANTGNNIISISVIPHTFENTNLKTLNSGDFVNIEVDIVSKYVEKFLGMRDNSSRISMSFLTENGF